MDEPQWRYFLAGTAYQASVRRVRNGGCGVIYHKGGGFGENSNGLDWHVKNFREITESEAVDILGGCPWEPALTLEPDSQPAPITDQPTQQDSDKWVKYAEEFAAKHSADGSSNFKFTPLVADGNLKFTPFVPDQPPLAEAVYKKLKKDRDAMLAELKNALGVLVVAKSHCTWKEGYHYNAACQEIERIEKLIKNDAIEQTGGEMSALDFFCYGAGGGNPKITSSVPDQTPPVLSSAFAVQIGGDHYKNLPIQPIEYCQRNGLGAVESFVVKYVTRWRTKGGVEDLRKAIHLLEILIEMETKHGH